jgi:hypothetical protein
LSSNKNVPFRFAGTVPDRLAAEVMASNQRVNAAIEHLNVEVARIQVQLSSIWVATWVGVAVLIPLCIGAIWPVYRIWQL